MKKTLKTKKVTLGLVVESIESLAIITKKGFDNTVGKTEFAGFKEEMYEFKEEMYEFKEEMYEFKQETKLTLFNMDSKLHTVDQRLDAIEKTLGPLVQVSSVMQNEIRELNRRVDRLEHKTGIIVKS